MDDRIHDHDSPATGDAVPGAGETKRRQRKGRLVARGASLDYAHRIACYTLVREHDGLHALLQVQGPTPDDARRGLEAMREVVEAIRPGIPSGSSMSAVLVAANERILELNATLRAEPGNEGRTLLRAQVTLLVRRPGGFTATYVGAHRVLALRRGRLVGPLVRPQEEVEGGRMVVGWFLGDGPQVEVADAEVHVEGGDLLVVATRPIIHLERPLDAIQGAGTTEGLQELANEIGGVITIPTLEPLPTPETGRANGLAWAALSSTGMRARNEDAYRIVGDAGIFVIGDGLGGHEDGAIASRLGVDTISEVYAAEGPWVPAEETARRACELAGSRVARSTADGGTTVDAVRVRDGVAGIAHLGDSRVYLFRDGRLIQLTKDHSWVAERVEAGSMSPEEARTHPQRNIVTRALGRKFDPPDVLSQQLRKGEILLLCTDGLSGPVEDARIAAILAESRGNLRRASTLLVDAAYERGAPDNVTVTLIAATGRGASQSPSLSRARARNPSRS